jgi:hypothetical protein
MLMDIPWHHSAACGEVRCHLDPTEALITLDESSTYIEREKKQRRAEVEKCQHELDGKL